MEKIEINENLAKKVKEVVSFGLSSGLGNPNPGEMCIEAAVNYACGLPHGDNPSCVGSSVRSFKIKLNDSNWSSKDSRAEGLKKIAVAQLGSNELNQIEFAEKIVIRTINVLLAEFLKDFGFEKESELCANANSLESAYAAAYAASAADAARAATRATAYATDAATRAAAYAADAATRAADAAAYARADANAADIDFISIANKAMLIN